MKKDISNYLEFFLGVLITALGYELFMLPTKVIYGVGGIAILLNKAFSLSVNKVIFILSVTLLIISYILLGKKQSRKSFIGSLLYPLLVYLISLAMPYFPSIEVETIVSVISGAVMTGIGLGLVMRAGFTTGGTDILNQIVAKFGKKTLGTAMLLTDGMIILCSLFILGISSFIYSVISIYIISIVADKVILGISSAKAFYIITSEEKKVEKYIMHDLEFATTIIDVKGCFTGHNKKVIMCVVPTGEYTNLKNGVLKIDSEAVILITDSYESVNV